MPREAARDSGRWVATVRLEIERMAYGADAIARDEAGKTVFVAGGVPGDVVEAEVTSEASSYSRARVTEVLEPSADRVRPACPYADVCGGCPWAQVSYEAQLRAKRANLVNSLVRIAKLDAERIRQAFVSTEKADTVVLRRQSFDILLKPRERIGQQNRLPRQGLHQRSGRIVLSFETDIQDFAHSFFP